MTEEDAANLESAIRRVQQHLDEYSQEDFHLIVYRLIERKSYRYIFEITTKEYEDTGNPLLLPVGGGPVVFDVENGLIEGIGTGLPYEAAVKRYEEKRSRPPRQ